MIQELRQELRELQAKQNEDREKTETEEMEQEESQQQSEQLQGPLVNPDGSAGEIENLQYWITRFCKHQPPVFKGRFDPQTAEDWIIRLEKIFRVMECPTKMKAQMAIYKMEGDADRWWKNTELILQARNIPITWELFQEKFNEKYFPRSVRIEKEAEFLALKQAEHETFDEYLSKFIRLSRYSSYLRYRDDESWSSDMLIRGLKPELKEKLVAKQFTEFNNAVEVCRITESNLKDLYPAKNVTSRGESSRGNFSQKRKGQGFKLRENNKRPFQPENRTYQRPPAPQPCSWCGKLHLGRNCTGQLICHTCKKPGHFSQDCPQRTAEIKPRPQNQGRIFALTHEEAQKSPEMIQGTIFLHGNALQALFDSGASHSFIAYDFAERLGLSTHKLPYDLVVSTPVGVKYVTTDVCSNCILNVMGHESTVDLICLPLHGIEVILGLNWLMANNVLLDCGSKRIVYPNPQKDVNASINLNFLSVAEAEKCLEKECQGYIVFFSVQSEVETIFENIPIVNEFPEVFPEDINGLPPEREVEFAIEIMPGAGPISKAPYRMAPNEMVELKKQIEELLEKGFI